MFRFWNEIRLLLVIFMTMTFNSISRGFYDVSYEKLFHSVEIREFYFIIRAVEGYLGAKNKKKNKR